MHRRTIAESVGSLAALICAFALVLPVPSLHADPDGGTVSGVVQLPPLIDRPKLPSRGRGFVKRIKGPLKEPKRLDPRPQMIVVLDGGPVASADTEPPKRASRYQLIGESFKTDVFAYVAGSTVEIKNDGHNTPRLYAVGVDDAIESGPVNPRGVRPIKAPTTALQSMEIRDRDSAHLSGTLVAMPHSYFALIGEDGTYAINGVPAGRWTVRVWYQGGWLKLKSRTTVTVAATRPVKAPTLKLPVALAPEPAGDTKGAK